jgi:hypothetical protein
MRASMFPLTLVGAGCLAVFGVSPWARVPSTAVHRASETVAAVQSRSQQRKSSAGASSHTTPCKKGVVCDDPAVKAGQFAKQEADTTLKERICEFLATYDVPVENRSQKEAANKYCSASAAEKAEVADPNSLPTLNLAAPPKVMIAILPDPVHTQLALSFDERVDELQNSMQDLGWTYDRAWLPWDNKEHKEDDDFDKRRENGSALEEYEKSPGVLLFRANPDNDQPKPLIVLVVGDTPTGGVHKIPFRNAIEIWKQLTGWDQSMTEENGQASLSILGPSFSGSIASLRAMLHELTFEASGLTDTRPKVGRDWYFCPEKGRLTIRIASGSVSSSEKLGSLSTPGDPCGKLNIRAVSMEVDGRYEDDRIFQFLTEHGPILPDDGESPPRVARLTEAESAFGWGFIPNAQHAHFFFPREISTLRAAYEQNGIFGFSSQSSAVKTQLHLSLGDSSNEDDTVHTFSGDQGPAALEAEMAQLTAELERQKIGIVVLSATDVLDEIFLTRYLAQHAPTVSVIVSDTDQLFLRGDSSMQNAYVIGPWPLLPGNEEWSVSPRVNAADPALPPVRIHDSGLGQALYAAARWLACQDGPGKICGADKEGRDVNIREYQSPFVSSCTAGDTWRTRPPLWLSAIGPSGFWPIALVDVDEDAKGQSTDAQGMDNLPALAPALDPQGIREPNPRSITLFTFLFAVLLLVHGLACVRAWLDRGFAWSYALGHKDHRGGRFGLQVAITLAVIPGLVLLKVPHSVNIHVNTLPYTLFNLGLQGLAVLLAMWHVLAYGTGDAWPGSLLEHTPAIDQHGNPLCKASARTVAKTWWRETRAAVVKERRFLALWLGMIGVGVVLCNTLLWSIIAPSAERWPTERIFFLYRSAHLFCGSAPTLPLLLLGGAFVVYLVSHFNRLIFHEDRFPMLPSCRATPPCPGPVDVERLTCLLSVRRDPAKVGLLVAVAAILLLFVSGLRDVIPHSLAHGKFDLIVLLLALGVTILICHDLAVAMMAWFLLRSDCLLKLKFSPLRWGFTWIKGLSWRKIWAPGATSPYRIYDYFQRLWEANERLDKSDELERSYRRYWRKFAESPRDGQWADDVTTLMGEVHQTLAHVASKKLAHLETLWAEDYGPITGWKETERGLSRGIPLNKGLFADSADPAAPPGAQKAVDEWVKTNRRVADEEFVALVYLGYIRLVLLQIRTRIMTSSAMYVLLLWALTSYPFLNHHYVLVGLSCLMGTLAVVVIGIYSQMHRDDILSRTTETASGKLGADFFTKVLPVVGVPLLTLIASQFPEISNLIFSWLEPGLSSMK